VNPRESCPLRLIVAITVAYSVFAAAQDVDPLSGLDLDRDGALSIEELKQYFLAQDPECANETDPTKQGECAELRAADFISANTPLAIRPGSLSLETARVQIGLFNQERVAEVLAARRAEQEKQTPRAYGWRVNRTLSDPAWLSAWKEDRPLVLSLKRDNQAAEGVKRDKYVVLGSIGYEFEPRVRTLDRRSHRTFAVGVEVDSDTSKTASESSVSLVAPVQWSWASSKAKPVLEGLALKVQPKFVTDRRFDREVFAADLTLAVAEESAAIGYLKYSSGWRHGLTPLLSFHWNPTLTVQALTVEDAAGNEKFAAIEGEGVGVRVIPRVQMSFGFPRTDGRLTFSVDGRAVWDETTGRTLGFGEGSVGFKISRFADLTLIYRRGYKGDDLTKVDEVLVGIGALFGS
jgi:hypothetical protein